MMVRFGFGDRVRKGRREGWDTWHSLCFVVLPKVLHHPWVQNTGKVNHRVTRKMHTQTSFKYNPHHGFNRQWLKNSHKWAGKIAQWVKALAGKPGDLSPIPRTYVVERTIIIVL